MKTSIELFRVAPRAEEEEYQKLKLIAGSLHHNRAAFLYVCLTVRFGLIGDEKVKELLDSLCDGTSDAYYTGSYKDPLA